MESVTVKLSDDREIVCREIRAGGYRQLVKVLVDDGLFATIVALFFERGADAKGEGEGPPSETDQKWFAELLRVLQASQPAIMIAATGLTLEALDELTCDDDDALWAGVMRTNPLPDIVRRVKNSLGRAAAPLMATVAPAAGEGDTASQ